MTKYLISGLAMTLTLSVVWSSYLFIRTERLENQRDAAMARATEAEQISAAARFNHKVAIEALREAEAERDRISDTLNHWRKTYAQDLDGPADPALLDLIDSLRPADGDDPEAD